MKGKIKNLVTGLSLLLALNGCVQHINHYHYPSQVEEEPIKIEKKLETKTEEQTPPVYETRTLEEKTTGKEEKEYFYLDVPGKETIRETGIYYVIISSEKCVQDARKSRQEGNNRLPFYVWDFKPVKNNPLRGVGIGSSLVTVVDGDTCVVGMSREKAEEILKQVKGKCYKKAYICPLR